MKYIILIIILFFSLFANLLSQKEAYNWDYGGKWVITFDTPDGEPKVLRESISSASEGCSSISDSNGRFLFSTGGVSAYSYTGIPDSIKLSNGFYEPFCTLVDLKDYARAGQTGLIVKQPGNNNNYYIFASLCKFENHNYFTTRYSIVDMDGNNGVGEMIVTDNDLFKNTGEKLIGIKHGNGKDVWIISHELNSRTFLAALLTEDGLEPEIVKSTTGVFHPLYGPFPNANKLHYSGLMSSNIDGDIITLIVRHTKMLDILSFDKMTGKITSLLNFSIDSLISNSLAYSVAFSPNSKKLYLSTASDNSKLIQFDISVLDSNIIKNTSELILYSHYAAGEEMSHGDLKLAPNGKIYIHRAIHELGALNTLSLYVINKPNLTGEACELRNYDKFNYLSYRWNAGLPNFVQGLIDFWVKIIPDSVCEGEDLVLRVDVQPDITTNKYTWFAPDGTQYSGKTLTIRNAKLSDAGQYKVTVDINSTIRSDSVMITILPKPIAKIIGDTLLCDGATLQLRAQPGANYKYKWSTGSTSDRITINKIGQYILTVENENGCIAYDTINVKIGDKLLFSILAPDYICLGDTIVLKTSLTGEGYKYNWSIGEKTPEIVITRGGEYSVTVVSDAGCTGTETITIEEFDKPEINFEKYLYELCEGESVTLRPLEIISENIYKWNDGLNSSERIISESGDYFLVAISPNGCTDTAFAEVTVFALPKAEILASSLSACFGEEITLSANNFNPDYNYLWSTGETSESITVSTTGKYKLKITNNICSDSTEIDVTIYPDLELELVSSPLSICNEEPVVISSKLKYDAYFWSTGETTEIITVTQAGLYSLRVENESGCTDSATIDIRQNNISLIPDKNSIDFGEICLGTKVTETLKLTVQTDSDLSISEIIFQNNYFAIENINSFIRTYSNGEVIELSINYTPQNIADFSDILIIKSNSPCEFTLEIPLSASSKMHYVFSLPVMKVESGASIAIPLYAKLACPDWQSITTDYEITIAFDAEYFYPDSVKYGEIVSNTRLGADRIITIKAPEAEFTPQNKIINYIYGKALVGRSEATALKINSVTFSEPKYYSETINGELTVEGCVNDLSGVQMFKPTALTVAPNPARDEITLSISTQEQGNFRIEIYDIHGKIVHKGDFKRGSNTLEIIEFNVNTKSIGNGTYTIQLITPWNKLSEQVMIMK
ncbi:MAG: T9SS type A sorting domain-containing protein [Candidatus Kapabacteria bacterium]|nr:T9SS type A sorting domain-containing protein [Candidatus Kapabacteria bacterium]